MQCERTKIVTSINGMTGDVIFDVPIIEDVYTKSEVDYLLSNKADTESVYTKSQIDVLLSNKADVNMVPTKLSDLEQDIEYADKNYVDEKIGYIDNALKNILGDE